MKNHSHFMIAILFFAIIIAGWFGVLVPKYAKLKAEKQNCIKLGEEFSRLDNNNHDLIIQRDNMNNPRAVERQAREEYNFCLEGEKIYRFDNTRK